MFKTHAQLLYDGQVLAGPTDTVFGLFADAANADAISQLYAMKGRDENVPLQVLVNSTTMAKQLALWDERAEKLAAAFWPGALTMVLAGKGGALVDGSALPPRGTIGIRWPKHDAVCGLIEAFGSPIVASSANKSGQAPAANIEALKTLFPDATLIDDGESGRVASTVVDLTGDEAVILREGEVSAEQIEACLA